MDGWRQQPGGQLRYTLEINDSPVRPDGLYFRGREALSEPFHWTIGFTTPQANIRPEQVLLKYATLRMRSGKAVHGVITGFEWLSATADQSRCRVVMKLIMGIPHLSKV